MKLLTTILLFSFLSYSMALVRFSVGKTNRGRQLITHGGYEYLFEADSRTEDGWSYWKCPRRPPYCPGRATVQSNLFVADDGSNYRLGRVTAQHNHEPVFGSLTVREANERLRDEARSDFPTTSRNVVRQVRADIPVDVRVGVAPSASNMQWNYNYTKRKHFEQEGDIGLDAMPPTNLLVPNALQNRVIYNQNLQGKKMLIFCSQFGLDALRNYGESVAIDGTFESCPRGFGQLYTMSVIIEHCAVPCAYGLLPNKNSPTYRIFFDSICASVGIGWYPARIMTDFEAGAINAAKIVYPNAIVSGCLFHLGKAFFRKIQSLPHLLDRYNNNEDVRKALRCVQALAFVPLNYVYNYFSIAMSVLEPIPNLQEFILYFIKTWIGPRHIIENEEVLQREAGGAADGWIRGQILALNLERTNALFPPALWNMVDRVADGLGRTNNSVEVLKTNLSYCCLLEGWHAVWNSHLKGNTRLSFFVRKMVEEDEMWERRVADFRAAPADGIRGPHEKRRAKWIRQDNNLRMLVEDFANRDPLDYLRACSYHLNF